MWHYRCPVAPYATLLWRSRAAARAVPLIPAEAKMRLAVGVWPANVKPKVDAMITALNTERAACHNCAAARSSAEVVVTMSKPGSVRSAG